MLQVAVQVGARIDDAAEPVVGGAVQLVGAHDQRGQLILEGVIELESVAIEDLEPIVSGRVVRGRDHDAGGVATAGRDVREGRRGADAQHVHVRSGRGAAGHERGHEHVSGAPRVLAHQDAATRPGQAEGDGTPQGVRQRRLQILVGDPADAIGAEEAVHEG